MALELAELAAGLPMAASFAMAGGIAAIREGRRRSSLNEAMHELRRPLQALALALPGDSSAAAAAESSLRMAVAALEQLDREVNGEPPPLVEVRVPLRPLVESVVERWRNQAKLSGGALDLCWGAGESDFCGDPTELVRALDNLISNALRHGGGEIKVEVRADAGVLRLAVFDSGAATFGSKDRGRPALRDRLTGRARHGHGLRIVRRLAADHGGSFRLRRGPGLTEARLELQRSGVVR